MTDDELKAQLDRIEKYSQSADSSGGCLIVLAVAVLLVMLFRACGG